jgi:hypothetical protein
LGHFLKAVIVLDLVVSTYFGDGAFRVAEFHGMCMMEIIPSGLAYEG